MAGTEKNTIRLLKADEIECRVSTVNEKGVSLLLYKDARVDQKILDETFGIFGWKRSHQCIDGNLYCTVEVFDKEKGEWVSKQDVGTVGHTEKEKSQASDSFKRACFNWGIGRELYTAPFIWVPAGKAAIQWKEGQDGKKHYYCSDRFSVCSIQYNSNREISGLIIVNGSGQAVYGRETQEFPGEKAKTAQKQEAAEKQEGTKGATQGSAISREQMDSLQAELARTGVAMEAVQERYRIQEPEVMGGELYSRVMNALKKTKTAGAA
ncbi:MAG: hypothetical protein OSJ44_13740 [Lachnospiraceae bacterium]|nr:hypothetical protein [Lachnospiraceae bacterium]